MKNMVDRKKVIKSFLIWTILLFIPIFLEFVLKVDIWDLYLTLFSIGAVIWYIKSGRLKKKPTKIYKDPVFIGAFFSLLLFFIFLIIF